MTTEHGGEILLLAPGWTYFIIVRRIVGHLPTMRRTTMRDVQPEASKRISQPCSLVIWSVVGKFTYSSQAGHLIVVWHVVASKRISPPCTEQRQEGPDCDEKENLPIML